MAELLSDDDLRMMTDLLSSSEVQADGYAGLPDVALVGLAELIRCDYVSFTDLDTSCATSYVDQTCDGRGVKTEGPIRDEDGPFWRYYWASLPCSYPTRTGDARSVTMLSDFYSQRQWHATPMYTN